MKFGSNPNSIYSNENLEILCSGDLEKIKEVE